MPHEQQRVRGIRVPVSERSHRAAGVLQSDMGSPDAASSAKPIPQLAAEQLLVLPVASAVCVETTIVSATPYARLQGTDITSDYYDPQYIMTISGTRWVEVLRANLRPRMQWQHQLKLHPLPCSACMDSSARQQDVAHQCLKFFYLHVHAWVKLLSKLLSSLVQCVSESLQALT